MNICEKCGRECKTPQALGAHLTLYHRVSEADLKAVRAEQSQKDEKVAELEADVAQRTDRLKILEAERQASACPGCGRLVAWNSLQIETRHHNPYYPLPFRFDGKPSVVKGKICPVCHYFEQAEEVARVVSKPT